MKSPSDTSFVKDEGANRDGVEQEGGATKSDYRDLNCALLRLTVAASIAHMTEKGSKEGKGTKKWHKIRVIAERKKIGRAHV